MLNLNSCVHVGTMLMASVNRMTTADTHYQKNHLKQDLNMAFVLISKLSLFIPFLFLRRATLSWHQTAPITSTVSPQSTLTLNTVPLLICTSFSALPPRLAALIFHTSDSSLCSLLKFVHVFFLSHSFSRSDSFRGCQSLTSPPYQSEQASGKRREGW